MREITSGNQGLSNLRNSEMKDQELQTMQRTALAAREQKNMDLEITTSEGDKVTLSTSSNKSMEYASYDRTGKSQGQSASVSEESLQIEVSSGFYLSVEGDLSEKELEDIGNIINDIDSVMGSMVSGDMNDALSKAMEIGGFETISGFEAELSYSKSMMMEQQTAVSGNLEAYEAQQETPEMPGVEASMDSLLDSMMENVSETTVEPVKLSDYVDNLFSRYDELLSEKEAPVERQDAFDMMHQRIMERVESLMGNIEGTFGEVV